MFQSSFFPQRKFRLTISSPSDSPVTFEVDPQKGISIVGTGLVVVGLLFAGTLLFFRELEINRRLEERVLELRTNEKIAKLLATTPAVPFVAQVPKVAPAAPIETAEVPELSAAVTVAARVSDTRITCGEGFCDAAVHLIPTAAGTTHGSLLLVLETELPHIGTAATAQPGQVERRVFHFYPTAPTQETFEKEEWKKATKKEFHFSRALTTKHQFQFDTVLKPLRLLIYVFDADAGLIQMEERTIHAAP